MKVYEQVKHATTLAKAKNYDEAIFLLNKLYETYDISNSDITKIIPYYQKAGRYDEIEIYCKKVLIPMVSRTNEHIFSHKCKEIQLAFISLSIYKIYNKLELCAKREKINSDRLKFSIKAASYYQLYETNLTEGNKVELQLEFLEMKALWGLNYDDWPEGFTHKFSSLME